MANNAIFNIGDWAKPIVVLIERLANLTGGFLMPYQMKRVADAQNEIDLERAEVDNRIALIRERGQSGLSELQDRARTRLVSDTERTQQNIESVVQKALADIQPDARPEDIKHDWLTNFISKVKDVSDDEMQGLWARILAGEANKPGAYSRRTLAVVDLLDRETATDFAKICRFFWNDIGLIVFDFNSRIQHDLQLSFSSYQELEALGLVAMSSIAFGFKADNQGFTADYFGRKIHGMPSTGTGEVTLGRVALTRAGNQLFPLTGATPIVGNFEEVLMNFRELGRMIVTELPYSG